MRPRISFYADRPPTNRQDVLLIPESRAMTPWINSLIILIVLSCAAFLPADRPWVDVENLSAGDTAWKLTATGLVLLMTPGLSLFYAGMASTKNVISTMLQSFICLGVVTLVWVVVGFSLAFGDSIGGLIGDPRSYFLFSNVGGSPNPDFAETIPFLLYALFQMKFAVVTPALITGSFAERVRFSGYLLFITLFSVFIYAPVAHWAWHPEGFLRKWGVLDFAGGTTVHTVAGFAALAGAWYMEQRESLKDGRAHAPANIPFVLIGTGMLWFGWFGFNAGSALSANYTACFAFLTTTTSSAAAMLTWIFYDAARGQKPSALGACMGAVVGLVAITPAAAFVSVGASIFIGVAASLSSNLCVQWFSRAPLDDTLDVFPCHGVGGMVGMLLTAVFAEDVGLIYGEFTTLGVHFLCLLIVGSFSFIGSLVLYWVTDQLITLRVSPEEERDGLDISQHGEFSGESPMPLPIGQREN